MPIQGKTMESNLQTQVTPEHIMQFVFGYAPSLILEVALHHRVFDVLNNTSKTIELVSEETGASARGLRAIMNALVGLALLSKDEEQRYSLTPESSAFLVSTQPSFLGGLLHHTVRGLLPQWMQLSEVVQTGKPTIAVNRETIGAPYFEAFVPALFPAAYPSAKVLANTLGLGHVEQPISVLDLAAGSGVWGIALAQASPQVRVTAVDWADVIPVTQRIAEQHGVGDRFQYLAGDLLEVDFGFGYQVVILGQILHSEGEVRSRLLLEKVFAALAPSGTIAISEWLTNSDRTGPLNALIFAVNMLVHTDRGDTFSTEEISGWLSDKGFIDIRTVEIPGPSPLILATKPH
ncbi:methyltransferase [Pseudanabaena sp. PCC 6802]|uniref:methyltransferase n=1 Tax=Pseudanabaena sp. PCC 6802 TaxID=118173 RepID=UPI00034524AB|nr:methyltransferase [Pseudanabaena sp. PCC 6802]